jgi:alpha-galactosidase
VVCAALASAAAAGAPAAASASLATTSALTPTPPMGWSSWYRYGCRVAEPLIRRTADAMSTNGMAAAGYSYVDIDDCWMTRQRDPSGALIANPRRFPDGIAYLAQYVHQRNLRLGIYLDTGSRTCTGFPGSSGHFAQDAQTVAAWGVDAVKLDFCRTRPAHAKPLYERFQQALADTGRRIMLEICEWGYESPWKWAQGIGSTWRTTGDYFSYGAPHDYWSAILKILDLNEGLAQYARPGAFNDPNALLVGTGVLTVPEERAQMSLWSVLAAPLIAGGDLQHISRDTLRILTNRDVIAIDQDHAGMQGTRVASDAAHQVWQRKLQDGRRALLFLNPTRTPGFQTFDLTTLGLRGDRTYRVRDLWQQRVITTPSTITVWVGARDVRLLLLSRDQAAAHRVGSPSPASTGST